jgi:ribosomal protein S27AE
VSAPDDRGFAYDDEQCPRRPGGLNHTQDGRARCGECGITTYSAKSRGLKWGEKKPSKNECQFSACGVTVTIRAWVRAWQTLEVYHVDHESWPTLRERVPSSVLEDESQETWLCFEHEKQVRDARKRTSVTIRRSVEGWLWVDNLDHLRFAV